MNNSIFNKFSILIDNDSSDDSDCEEELDARDNETSINSLLNASKESDTIEVQKEEAIDAEDNEKSIKNLLSKSKESDIIGTPKEEIIYAPYNENTINSSLNVSDEKKTADISEEMDNIKRVLEIGQKIYTKKQWPRKSREQNDNRSHDPATYKRVLCDNVLTIGTCNYSDKCVFAHSLEEQRVDTNRKIAYDIIKMDSDISNLDLIKNKQLYNTFVHLTKLCTGCVKGNCQGGYNCKFGSCCKEYQICYTDFLYGTCDKKNNCRALHLTDRNFIPYTKQKELHLNNTWNSYVRPSQQNKPSRTRSVNRKIRAAKPKYDLGIIKSSRKIRMAQGEILNDKYFKNNIRDTKEYDSDISMSDDEIERNKDLINNETEIIDIDVMSIVNHNYSIDVENEPVLQFNVSN